MADDGFSNPLVSNGGNLIRQWIQSPDFVTGVSGWQIARSGDAEFNDLTARGVLDINNTGGTGANPGLWIGPASHPDFPPEILVLEGINDAVYAQVSWFNSDTYEAIVLTTDGTTETVWRVSVNRLAAVNKVTIQQSAFIGGSAQDTTYSTIEYGSGDNGVRADGTPATYHLFQFCALNIGRAGSSDPLETPWTVDGTSFGRGLVNQVFSAVNSAAIGAEAIVLTLPSMTFQEGRAYRVECNGLAFGSVANFATYQMRRTNLAGAVVQVYRFACPAGAGAAVTHRNTFHIGRAAGAGNLASVMVLTVAASVGTVTHAGGATFPRWAKVYDAGAVADFPDAVLVV